MKRSNGHARWCDCESCQRIKKHARRFGESAWHSIVCQEMRKAEAEAFNRGKVTVIEERER